MSALPDETLRRILAQIQQTSVNSQRQLAISKNTTAAKERERKVLQLTIDELSALDKTVNLYKGVGKMFVLAPRTQMDRELKEQEKELTDELTALQKKTKFHEKAFNEAQAQLRDIFHNAPKS